MNTGFGGAIFSFSIGVVNISRSTLRNNIARVSGGAIDTNLSQLTITDSTINGNSAGNEGGGVDVNGGMVVIRNSTISGNTATTGNGGGGLFNESIQLNPQVRLENVTVTANIAGGPSGDGIHNEQAAASITLVQTIIVNVGPDCGTNGGGFTANAYNLDSDGTCVGVIADTDLTDITAVLGPLASNGGPTQTHALLAGSVAIDHVPNASCIFTTDQRGFPRPSTAGGNCDIGAYEFP